MGYRMAMGGGGGMDGAVTGEKANILTQLMAKLPAPAQVLVHILLVVAAAAVVGMIVGKMYASIKYPDPEKHHIIPPKLKVLFICILAACCVWLYTTMTREEPKPSETDPGMGESESQSPEPSPDGGDLPVSIDGGTAVVAIER